MQAMALAAEIGWALMNIPEPRRVLNLFRMGDDTAEIAAKLTLAEAVVSRLLASARDIEWFECQREHKWRKDRD